VEVEVEKPHLHHRRTGHHWFDLVVPIAALFVSLISIWIAYHHGQVMQELVHQNERLVQANSLPHLSLERTFNRRGEDTTEVRHSIGNNGVGPAEVRWAQTTLDGRPFRNIEALLRACCGSLVPQTSGTLTGRMISPQASFDYLVLTASPGTGEQLNKFAELALNDRIMVKVCYCSVFDECWTLQSGSGAERPHKVNSCPAAAEPET
jgi:hypothetical protein